MMGQSITRKKHKKESKQPTTTQKKKNNKSRGDDTFDSSASFFYLPRSSPPISEHLFKFLFLLSLLGHAVSSIGLLLGCLIPVPIIAVMLCPLTVIPFMLTSGFFINLTTIPSYLDWITVLSPHRYHFTGLMGLEFQSLQLHCDEDEISTVLLAPDSKTPELFQYCSMILGRQVLDMLSLPYDEYWIDVGALILLSFGFRLLAYLILVMSVRENRLKWKGWRRQIVRKVRRSFVQIWKDAKRNIQTRRTHEA